MIGSVRIDDEDGGGTHILLQGQLPKIVQVLTRATIDADHGTLKKARCMMKDDDGKGERRKRKKEKEKNKSISNSSIGQEAEER